MAFTVGGTAASDADKLELKTALGLAQAVVKVGSVFQVAGVTVDLVGADGPPGDEGPVGPTGQTGATGPAGGAALGPYATSAALQTAFPAVANIGKHGSVGSAAPYADYVSDGVAWQAVSMGGGVLASVAAKPVDFNLMALPPTVTVSAAGGPSLITNGVSIPQASIDQWPIPPGGRFAQATIIDDSPEAPNSTGATTRAPVNYYFATDATQFEVVQRPDGSNSDFRVFVDGRLATGVIAGTSFTGVSVRVNINFGGSRKLRQIEICGQRVPFDSITVGPNDSIGVPLVPAITCTITGDSFAAATGASSPCLGFADMLAKRLGIRRIHTSGLGGTGYSGTTSGTRKRLRYRFQTDIAPYPADVLIHCDGVNDAGSPTLLADASAAFDQAQSAFPNAIQIVFPGFGSQQGLNASTRDAIRTAAAGRRNFYFIDTYADGELTGLGDTSAPTASGNVSWAIGPDHTHPTDPGHFYLAQNRDAEIRRALGLA